MTPSWLMSSNCAAAPPRTSAPWLEAAPNRESDNSYTAVGYVDAGSSDLGPMPSSVERVAFLRARVVTAPLETKCSRVGPARKAARPTGKP